MGINPGGGNPDNAPESSISRHIEHILKRNCADWSGYRDDGWDNKPGKHFLQRNVLHLLNKVGKKELEHKIPASEVVFLKSRGVSDLKRLYGKGYEELADECWPFHGAVIDKLEVRVVVVYGKRSGEYVRRRLNAHKQVDEIVATYGKGKRIASGAYTNDKGQTVVTLWFPGMGNPWWTNPKTDPTGLVVDALSGQVQ